MKFDSIKQNVGSFWDNLAEGWKHLTEFASGALTRFRAGDATNLPDQAHVDDQAFVPTRSWAVIGGDLFEDEQRLVLRLELPGVSKEDLAIEVLDDMLVVSGEKRFERESTEGRWRVMQCAYGAFRRTVPLPVAVVADQARASYRNGVLRVELPKVNPGKPKSVRIDVV
jgi:HSP20 family protein